MKGVSRHVFVRIVQAIIMKRLVCCFKLDNDEFNLKNTSLVLQGFLTTWIQFISIFQIIKLSINIKLMTILTFH